MFSLFLTTANHERPFVSLLFCGSKLMNCCTFHALRSPPLHLIVGMCCRCFVFVRKCVFFGSLSNVYGIGSVSHLFLSSTDTSLLSFCSPLSLLLIVLFDCCLALFLASSCSLCSPTSFASSSFSCSPTPAREHLIICRESKIINRNILGMPDFE